MPDQCKPVGRTSAGIRAGVEQTRQAFQRSVSQSVFSFKLHGRMQPRPVRYHDGVRVDHDAADMWYAGPSHPDGVEVLPWRKRCLRAQDTGKLDSLLLPSVWCPSGEPTCLRDDWTGYDATGTKGEEPAVAQTLAELEALLREPAGAPLPPKPLADYAGHKHSGPPLFKVPARVARQHDDPVGMPGEGQREQSVRRLRPVNGSLQLDAELEAKWGWWRTITAAPDAAPRTRGQQQEGAERKQRVAAHDDAQRRRHRSQGGTASAVAQDRQQRRRQSDAVEKVADLGLRWPAAAPPCTPAAAAAAPPATPAADAAPAALGDAEPTDEEHPTERRRSRKARKAGRQARSRSRSGNAAGAAAAPGSAKGRRRRGAKVPAAEKEHTADDASEASQEASPPRRRGRQAQRRVGASQESATPKRRGRGGSRRRRAREAVQDEAAPDEVVPDEAAPDEVADEPMLDDGMPNDGMSEDADEAMPDAAPEEADEDLEHTSAPAQSTVKRGRRRKSREPAAEEADAEAAVTPKRRGRAASRRRQQRAAGEEEQAEAAASGGAPAAKRKRSASARKARQRTAERAEVEAEPEPEPETAEPEPEMAEPEMAEPEPEVAETGTAAEDEAEGRPQSGRQQAALAAKAAKRAAAARRAAERRQREESRKREAAEEAARADRADVEAMEAGARGAVTGHEADARSRMAKLQASLAAKAVKRARRAADRREREAEAERAETEAAEATERGAVADDEAETRSRLGKQQAALAAKTAKRATAARKASREAFRKACRALAEREAGGRAAVQRQQTEVGARFARQAEELAAAAGAEARLAAAEEEEEGSRTSVVSAEAKGWARLCRDAAAQGAKRAASARKANERRRRERAEAEAGEAEERGAVAEDEAGARAAITRRRADLGAKAAKRATAARKAAEKAVRGCLDAEARGRSAVAQEETETCAHIMRTLRKGAVELVAAAERRLLEQARARRRDLDAAASAEMPPVVGARRGPLELEDVESEEQPSPPRESAPPQPPKTPARRRSASREPLAQLQKVTGRKRGRLEVVDPECDQLPPSPARTSAPPQPRHSTPRRRSASREPLADLQKVTGRKQGRLELEFDSPTAEPSEAQEVLAAAPPSPRRSASAPRRSNGSRLRLPELQTVKGRRGRPLVLECDDGASEPATPPPARRPTAGKKRAREGGDADLPPAQRYTTPRRSGQRNLEPLPVLATVRGKRGARLPVVLADDSSSGSTPPRADAATPARPATAPRSDKPAKPVVSLASLASEDFRPLARVTPKLAQRIEVAYAETDSCCTSVAESAADLPVLPVPPRRRQRLSAAALNRLSKGSGPKPLPKGAKAAYSFFRDDRLAAVQAEHPDSTLEDNITVIRDMWACGTDAEKEEYLHKEACSVAAATGQPRPPTPEGVRQRRVKSPPQQPAERARSLSPYSAQQRGSQGTPAPRAPRKSNLRRRSVEDKGRRSTSRVRWTDSVHVHRAPRDSGGSYDAPMKMHDGE